MSEISKCNRCGAPLPSDSPEGLCPRCLVAMNLATQTEIAGETQTAKPPHAPPLPIDQVAKLFPQLEILECLGRGGMGAVYKARQPRLDRIVALKILSPEKQNEPKFAERFEREARALAKLHHPNIVTVFDFGEAQGNFYLLMEFVDGLTLRQLLQARKLSSAEALTIVPKICEALQYAHEQGIVHRDIKPENILLDKNGQLKIADFGIAKILGDGGRANLTEDQTIGTPHYMSPEQIEKPQTVDHRADIYSLGVVFYEMLTGELPLGKFSPPSKKVQIDVRLDEIVLRALEKEPERRYQQASDVKTQLETITTTEKSEIRSPKSEIEPRFSRTSIAGICWLAIFVLVAIPTPTSVRVSAITFGLFGTMILGWIAVFQICRSAGKLHGMWLAIFDGLFFPLLALDALIAGFWIFLLKVVFLDHLMVPICALLALTTIVCIDFIIIRFVWRTLNQPVAASAPPVQKPDRFWRWFAVTVLAFISIPFLISIFGILAAIAIPNFIKGRQHALALREQQITATNFFIGQTWFPQSDSIEITSVERNENQMTVKGHYNLVSHDEALLALSVTTTNQGGLGEQLPILKGRGDFSLIHSLPVPGLPHVSMYADGHPFASLYFGNKQEAAKERAASWITNEMSAAAETWFPALAPREKPDPQKILDEAKDLMAKGDYEAALQRHIWYFNHALEYNSGLTGVRLSFALSEWVKLAHRYPKAMQALTEIRDRDTQMLLTGQGSSDLFSDVNSINNYLNESDATYALFKTLDKKDPKLAQQCYFYAESLLVQKGEYALCRKYMGDPQFRFDLIQENWESELDVQKQMARTRKFEAKETARINQNSGRTNSWSPPDNSKNLKKFATDRFVSQTRQLIEILVATADKPEAEKIQGEASAILDDPKLKSAVSDAEGKIQKLKSVIDPNTGLPATPGSVTKINPATGLPISAGETTAINPEEIDPNTGLPATVVKSDQSQILADQPPVVVETFPVSGARDVAPGETEIRVRFSKEMADESWSWSTAWENSAPEFIGQPHYASDDKTCVAKVKLEPNKTYAFWLNSENFHNFKDKNGRPAIPYLLIFQTKQN